MEIKELSAELNGVANRLDGGDDLKELVQDVVYTHPTINQSFTGRFILQFVKTMAERYESNCYDRRNEAACKACKAMWDGLLKEFPYMGKDGNYVSLPLI